MSDHEAAKNQADLIVESHWIIPVEPANTLLENHSLVVRDQKIVDILPTGSARQQYRAPRCHSLNQHVLIPGLVNLHTHAAMALLRGFADDLPLMPWLTEHIWPAERAHVSPEFVRDGTLLACWEMLRGGVTCFNDMYFYPEAAASAALAAGIRAALGITVFEFPSAYGTGADDYLDKGLAARERLAKEDLISFCLAPHAPYTVADKTFEKIRALSERHHLPVHIHLHETQDEIDGSLKEHGTRPLARLQRLGLPGPRMIAVHAVHMNPDEVGLLASTGSHVAHCPTSNMKLASGIAPISGMLQAGIGVGLGTDGAASNNRLDLFHELRHAALLAKVATHDAASLPAHQALRMATLEGARALGLGETTGSLLPGKAADFVAVQLDDWDLQPCYDPASHLVYVAGREHVSHVWVNGSLRIENKNPVDLDIPGLLDRTHIWHNTLSNQGKHG